MLLRPGLLSGAVLFRAMVPLEPPDLPDLDGLPVLLLVGRTDTMIPPESAERLAEILTQAGANLTLQWREGGHELSTDDFLIARDWLRNNFGDPPAS